MTVINLGRIKPIDRGAWSATYNGGLGYGELDIVQLNGDTYQSKTAENTAEVTDATKWTCLAKVGDKAQHGYPVGETPKTLKQVDDSVSQFAGDVKDTTEKAGAASLAELNARLLALEKIVSATITNKLEVTKEFNVWGKTNLILTGSGAATFAPDFVGQKYIDTAGGNIYVAVGVSTAGNWKLV